MVIQRWQSVLLLIAAVMMACFTFCSLGQVQLPDYSLNFTTLGFSYEGEATGGAPTGYYAYTWIFFTISLLSALLALIDIFLFKNLRLQKSVCLIDIVCILGAIGVGCGYGYTTFDGVYVSWSSLIVAPVIAFVADIMAYNRICKDQNLLRSADRLR